MPVPNIMYFSLRKEGEGDTENDVQVKFFWKRIKQELVTT